MVLIFSIMGTVFSYAQKYEAEDATYGGGAQLKVEATFSGTGFLGNFADNGQYVEFSVNAATEGIQNIKLYYTTGIAGSLNLYVNGTLIGTQNIPTTGGWSNWTPYSVNVSLNAGANTIKFQHDASNTGFYYIDYLQVPVSGVTGVSLSASTLNLTDITSSILTATVTPESAPNKAVEWASSNTAVALVFDGRVVGRSAGTATITATTVDGGKTATCAVTVTASNATKYEAEDATRSGLNLTTDQPGYSGTAFVNAFVDSGSYLQFSVSAPAAGNYDVTLCFATGTGLPLDFYVNDVKIKEIGFPNTGNWGNWAYHKESVALNAGTNTIKYQKGTGSGYLNADYITLKEVPAVPQFVQEAGTAYRWFGNTDSSSDLHKYEATALNDGDLSSDVPLAGGSGEPEWSGYEAAGLLFSSAKTITKVEYVNGTFAGVNNGVMDDGCFDANFKLQISTDGTTWTDATGWSLSPAYEYWNTSVSGATFTFTGSAADVLGIRVTGQVKTSDATGSWEARTREINAYSGGGTIFTKITENVKEIGLSLFPNPFSSSSLSIKLPEDATQLSIFDITGKAVYQTQVTMNEYLINQSVFQSKGIYIVNVITAKGSKNQKLIVTK